MNLAQIWRCPDGARMDGRAKLKAQGLSARHGHLAFRTLSHGFPSEGIGDKNPIIPVVPPTGAKVRWRCHQEDSHSVLLKSA